MNHDIELFQMALELAVEAHKGQKRKGSGDPYILHPLNVMFIVERIKKSVNKWLLGTCSLLHDLPEDTEVTLRVILEKFGPQVASIVDELTNDPKEIEAVGKRIYMAQKMLKISSYALVIKLADRYHNLTELNGMDEAFIQNQVHDTKYILLTLKERKLTRTHKKLIKLIEKIVNKY